MKCCLKSSISLIVTVCVTIFVISVLCATSHIVAAQNPQINTKAGGNETPFIPKLNYVPTVTLPTCTEGGYTTYYCAHCKDSYVTNYTDALCHTIANWEHNTQNYWHVCTVCGEVIETKTIPVIRQKGDINGDGKVNNKDITRLFQYLSDWDVNVNRAALDINNDNAVNNKDLTRLFQYLSGWNVEIF